MRTKRTIRKENRRRPLLLGCCAILFFGNGGICCWKEEKGKGSSPKFKMTAPRNLVPLSQPLRHFVNLAQQEQTRSLHWDGTDRLRPELIASDCPPSPRLPYTYLHARCDAASIEIRLVSLGPKPERRPSRSWPAVPRMVTPIAHRILIHSTQNSLNQRCLSSRLAYLPSGDRATHQTARHCQFEQL